MLNGKIEDFKPDKLADIFREKPYLPMEDIDLQIAYENISFEDYYYLYVIAFYKDQDNNLYDTVHMLAIPFKEPRFNEKGKKKPVVDESKLSGPTERYNTYYELEYKKLHTVLKKANNPIRDYIPNTQ